MENHYFHYIVFFNTLTLPRLTCDCRSGGRITQLVRAQCLPPLFLLLYIYFIRIFRSFNFTTPFQQLRALFVFHLFIYLFEMLNQFPKANRTICKLPYLLRLLELSFYPWLDYQLETFCPKQRQQIYC